MQRSPEEIKQALGATVRELRRAHRLTQEDLAERAGVHAHYVSDIERGLRNVAVTAGYVAPGAREELFGVMDAANVDLKAFTEDFYRKLCTGHLADVLETLEYIRRETDVWLEITTLLIPGHNDGVKEVAGA